MSRLNLFLLSLAALDPEVLTRLEAMMEEGHQRNEPKDEPEEVDQELAAWARKVLHDPATDPAECERAEDILADLEEGHVVSVYRGTSTVIWQRTQEWERKPEELRIGSRLWRPRASC
jgi:hypothetical protein